MIKRVTFSQFKLFSKIYRIRVITANDSEAVIFIER